MEQRSVSRSVSFMDNLHDRGMKVTLNVHPALGIRECESMYKEMAEAMGMDPAAGEPVEFDITDRSFWKIILRSYIIRLRKRELISGGWTGSRVDIRQ